MSNDAQNFGGPFMKYSDAYFDGEIAANVFSLISIMAVCGYKQQPEPVKEKIGLAIEKLFSKKHLTDKEEQAIKKELRKLYRQKGLPETKDVEDAMDEISRILG